MTPTNLKDTVYVYPETKAKLLRMKIDLKLKDVDAVIMYMYRKAYPENEN